MKIVVMSDTHLRQVTDEFRSICDRYCRDADMVIHLGDMAAGSILDFLAQYPLEAVAGNMDDQVIQQQLASKKIIRLMRYRVGIVHGWGSASNLRGRLSREFTDVDAIFFGHTHQALQLQENGVFWFNPGSVSLGRGGSPRSLGVLHIQERIRSEVIPLE